MSNKSIKFIVFLGAISIVGILSAQIYWILKSYDLQERQFQHSVQVALIRVAKSIEEYNGSALPTKDLISRRASNYYVVNVNDVIDANILEFYLERELEAAALDLDFEYGIYDCANDKMVYGNYISSGDLNKEKPTTELPKYDEFTYYFGVRFPTITAELISNMRLVIFFTIILLFATAFFVYALSVILKQKRLSETQKDFINNMTHEFKTPLSTIAISSDVFLKHPLVKEDSRLFKYAQFIKNQAKKLTGQVENVLQIVKVENDSFRLNKELVDIIELIRGIVNSYEIKLESKNGQLQTDLPDKKVWVNADKLHTINIIGNLLDNAIKYHEGEDLIIEIRAELKGGTMVFNVEDNGPGIPKEYHQQIFEKFFRVPTGDLHNVKGFGLGLFYVKSICAQQKWSLDMKSSPDQGTTFIIQMPVIRVESQNKEMIT